MIKNFLYWLKSLYYIPATVNETTTNQEISMSKLTLSIMLNNQLASGSTANLVQAAVTDDAGTAVVGAVVTFSADNGAVVTALSASTDANGLMNASVTNATMGNSTVIATLADGASATGIVAFSAQPTSANATMASTAATTVLPATAVVSSPPSPLADFKARVEAFVAFVENGIDVLGKDAEAELVALKEKYF